MTSRSLKNQKIAKHEITAMRARAADLLFPISKGAPSTSITREDLAALAVRYIGEQFAILESRGLDSLDFHDAGVVGVREALIAAYELGRKSAGVKS